MIFQPILALHIACGLVAVVAGGLPIVTRKGSALHRVSGWIFTGLMGMLLVCAWVMTALHFNPYFAALTATATITVFSGVRVLKRKRPDLRRADRARALDWILTLIVVGVGLWVLVLILRGQTGGRTAVSAALVYGALTYGGWDLWRFARPTAWPFFPDLWTYEHLVKMLSAYGAVMSAFSGNFLTFLPTPWRQLWPTLVFQSLAVIWILSRALRRRRDLSPA
ncbi:hypothetical protein ACN2C7_04655 [Caulobacter sp. ErkDOM-E]|uniref:hypothetical protein n=1 Tax=Caulobacter sp. ErkDOM-E TaxID=3402778 RepID=UPI003AF54979